MKLSFNSGALRNVKTDAIAIGLVEKKFKSSEHLRALDKLAGGKISSLLRSREFEARPGQVIEINGLRSVRADHIWLIGLGEARDVTNAARLLGTKASQLAREFRSLTVVSPWEAPPEVRTLSEGVTLGAYRFTDYLTGERKPKRRLEQVSLWLEKKPTPEQQNAATMGQNIGNAINLVRDLVNAPPNDLHPRALAERARKEAKSAGIECRIFDKKQIEKEKMELFLAVNRGSAEEPRLVHLIYKPKSIPTHAPRVVFVGKGLTFDSGGLCIKPANSMIDMKCDMAGSAVTLAVLLCAARLKLPLEVHGVIAATENMPDAAAYRPGDIYTSLNGKSVEIINTDAEGRLVLADALTYTCKQNPNIIVDHATLTGACMVALGPATAGLFSNSPALGQRYLEAARSVEESVWPMPLTEYLKDELRSDVADLKHTGERFGGAITAALFLEHFVENTPWVHMDIAGPAFLEKPRSIYPKGGSGFGVLTAVAFLESLVAQPLKL